MKLPVQEITINAKIVEK